MVKLRNIVGTPRCCTLGEKSFIWYKGFSSNIYVKKFTTYFALRTSEHRPCSQYQTPECWSRHTGCTSSGSLGWSVWKLKLNKYKCALIIMSQDHNNILPLSRDGWFPKWVVTILLYIIGDRDRVSFLNSKTISPILGEGYRNSEKGTRDRFLRIFSYPGGVAILQFFYYCKNAI